ncbi:hypothetical protein [Gimesia maris]|uniref:hypothetical protein n=1 Tax=Gimesia maris TaxID=122 RepID=UPI0030DC4B1A|tara:strand:- start:45820 stop:46353 length:534 start_codon:yes stop_codon:yes gene_type:complete
MVLSPAQNRLLNIAALIFAAFGLAWIVYLQAIRGTTAGPDFVQALKSGKVTADSVTSIEVVVPPPGYSAFTASEYERLTCLATITDQTAISHLLTNLQSARPGRYSQNHPSLQTHMYLKVNCQEDFFWLNVEEYQDARSAVLTVEANTRNALNPNGATLYYLRNYSEVLDLLQQKEK